MRQWQTFSVVCSSKWICDIVLILCYFVSVPKAFGGGKWKQVVLFSSFKMPVGGTGITICLGPRCSAAGWRRLRDTALFTEADIPLCHYQPFCCSIVENIHYTWGNSVVVLSTIYTAVIIIIINILTCPK